MKIGLLCDALGYKLMGSENAGHVKIYTIEDGALHEEEVKKIGDTGKLDVLIGKTMSESVVNIVRADIYLLSGADWVIKALEGYVMGTENMKKYRR